MPITVGIIGLGQIAQGYDTPSSDTVTTHIKACLRDSRIDLRWIADTDAAKASAVRARWNLGAEILAPEALLGQRPDVVCIATPDATHGDFVRAALANPPKLILCEKPLAATGQDALALITACENAGTVLVLNYMRRWLPHVAEWIAAARSGAFGPPAGATGLYCRGLVHNACHNFDLIGAALGAVDVEAECIGIPVADYAPDDPTVSVLMSVRAEGRRVPVLLTGIDGRMYNQWAVDIMFEASRLRVWNDDGIHVETYAPAAGSFVYAPELRPAARAHDKPALYMENVWRNIAEHLAGGAPLRATARGAEDGLRLLDAAAAARQA